MKKFLVEVRDGEVYINGEFASQLCWTNDAVGSAVAIWLDEHEEIPEIKESKPCVVVNYTFDPEMSVYEYDDEDSAKRGLKMLFNESMKEEVNNHSDLNEECCYVDVENGYAQIQWSDGDLMSFTVAYTQKGECDEQSR